MTGLAISGVIHLVAGVISVVYTRTMGIPLREYMADNLRSNYTGGFGIGYLERQFDRSVDWVQINVILIIKKYIIFYFIDKYIRLICI